ncbi:MAG TPA: hypothetical protein PLO29_01525 [Paludibacter sp.]|nr:hypothetical protein [Paludibacter sp.]
MSKIKKSLCNFTELGALAQIPLHFFVLIQKNEAKKNQDCARFARKISARTAKSSKLATSLLRQGRFLTLFLLIFRLTGRGQLPLSA